MAAKRFNIQLTTMGSILSAYQDVGNAVLNGDIEVPKASVAERCIKGAVYLGGTLPVKLNELILRYKGSPFVDIPLAEAEGKKMLRAASKS